VEIDRRLFLFSLTAPLYAAAPLQTFTAAEANLVEALCDQIIPADDSPGAKEAGVLYYLDQQLAGPLKRFASSYKTSLPLLDEGCQQSEGKPFLELPSEAQTRFLHRLETDGPPELRSFFRIIVDQTMQGFYGSPSHGGNRDAASWKMLGIEGAMTGHTH
jgi:gluconate 2-dehydrogenase gamma chain